jgi:hypothetical protein
MYIIKIVDLCKIVYWTVKLVKVYQIYIVLLKHKWNLVSNISQEQNTREERCYSFSPGILRALTCFLIIAIHRKILDSLLKCVTVSVGYHPY